MVQAPHMNLDPTMGELEKAMALELPFEQNKRYAIYSHPPCSRTVKDAQRGNDSRKRIDAGQDAGDAGSLSQYGTDPIGYRQGL